jgi:hypothetical protein
MGKRFVLSVGTWSAALLTTALTWGTPAASADVDTTPPTLVTPERSSWAVGTQVGTRLYCEIADHWVETRARQVVGWTVSDDSGAVASSVTDNAEGYFDQPVDVDPAATRLVAEVYDWQQDCGGGESQSPIWWTITATDGSGNSASALVDGGDFSATQEDGERGVRSGGPRLAMTFSPEWRDVSGKAASAGGFARTTQDGAWVDVHITRLTSHSGLPELPVTGSNVGIVMRKGPKAAAFDVYRNGDWVAHVDPYAARSRARMIVWQGWVELDDTLRLVRVDGLHAGSGAQGRAILTLDAVLAN